MRVSLTLLFGVRQSRGLLGGIPLVHLERCVQRVSRSSTADCPPCRVESCLERQNSGLWHFVPHKSLPPRKATVTSSLRLLGAARFFGALLCTFSTVALVSARGCSDSALATLLRESTTRRP